MGMRHTPQQQVQVSRSNQSTTINQAILLKSTTIYHGWINNSVQIYNNQSSRTVYIYYDLIRHYVKIYYNLLCVDKPFFSNLQQSTMV